MIELLLLNIGQSLLVIDLLWLYCYMLRFYTYIRIRFRDYCFFSVIAFNFIRHNSIPAKYYMINLDKLLSETWQCIGLSSALPPVHVSLPPDASIPAYSLTGPEMGRPPGRSPAQIFAAGNFRCIQAAQLHAAAVFPSHKLSRTPTAISTPVSK